MFTSALRLVSNVQIQHIIHPSDMRFLKYNSAQLISGIPTSTLSMGLPGGPVVQSPPCSARDAGSIPGQGTKIPHAMEQLSLYHNLSPCTPKEDPL